MFRGLYSGATALDYLERRHQITSSNLAHLNSTGHRRAVFSIHERADQAQPDSANPGAKLSNNIDFKTPGRLQMTQRKLDISLRGDGFFQYQGPSETLYSKNGVLFRSPEGQLVNRDGMPLLGENGPIAIPADASNNDILIGSDGTISVNDQQLGKIAIVKFDNNQLLASESQIEFRKGKATALPADEATIVQGAREQSNAQPVTELINLIITSRHFEAAQRAIRTISESIQQHVQE